MNILTIKELSKKYKSVLALDTVSFSIPKGSVFGILGPNGSGKTTLLGIVMDVLKPTSGQFLLFEQTPDASLRKQIGTLLETPNFYHYMSASDNLKIAAAIKNRGHDDINRVLEITGLYERKNDPFSTYSLGMKQRLAIASALLGNPDVLVLDEPTNGLDPAGIADIRQLIIKLASQGKTIIIASHMLDEVEKVCTDVAILKYGKLITTGSVNDILGGQEDAMSMELSADNIEHLFQILQQWNAWAKLEQIHPHLIQLTFKDKSYTAADLNRFCHENGIILTHLLQKKQRLESKFLELTN